MCCLCCMVLVVLAAEWYHGLSNGSGEAWMWVTMHPDVIVHAFGMRASDMLSGSISVFAPILDSVGVGLPPSAELSALPFARGGC